MGAEALGRQELAVGCSDGPDGEARGGGDAASAASVGVAGVVGSGGGAAAIAAAAAAGGSKGGCVVSRRVKTIETGEAEALSMLMRCETGRWRAGWPLSEVSTWLGASGQGQG